MKKIISPILMTLLILCSQFNGSCSVKGRESEKVVKKAFELRMNGKVDEAKALLNEILTNDSTNAMAWYELARLKHYMLVGGSEVKIADIVTPINKAVNLEPKNVTYAYYKAIASFLNAFMSMQMGQGEVKNIITETCAHFEKVLTLKPDYHDARMYLVEIYGLLPPEMGGDSAKAQEQSKKLMEADPYFGTKAKAALASEGTDIIKLWEDLIALNSQNADFYMEAGKACLFMEEPKAAELNFDLAIKLDPAKNILILDLARYHVMMVMQKRDVAATELPIAKTYLEKYLKSLPEPNIPLKTYTMGLLARVEMFLGNQAEAEKLMDEAKSLDPYFSRASGVPTLLLFDPPDQISHHYFSFFSPF
jgi:tetratricopeptide (TPR) repeat protein